MVLLAAAAPRRGDQRSAMGDEGGTLPGRSPFPGPRTSEADLLRRPISSAEGCRSSSPYVKRSQSSSLQPRPRIRAAPPRPSSPVLGLVHRLHPGRRHAGRDEPPAGTVRARRRPPRNGRERWSRGPEAWELPPVCPLNRRVLHAARGGVKGALGGGSVASASTPADAADASSVRARPGSGGTERPVRLGPLDMRRPHHTALEPTAPRSGGWPARAPAPAPPRPRAAGGAPPPRGCRPCAPPAPGSGGGRPDSGRSPRRAGRSG